VTHASQNVETRAFEILQETDDQQKDPKEKEDSLAAQEAPVMRIVYLIIKEALHQRASDIHMEPQEQGIACAVSHRWNAAGHIDHP